MEPYVIGEPLLARDANGQLKSPIATAFPQAGAVVTTPGIHATQRLDFQKDANRRRQEQGLPPLTQAEVDEVFLNAVDLYVEDVELGDGTRDARVLIRPDTANLTQAFAADELLQLFVSKRKIKFLNVLDERVREAIKRRGDRWRMSPLPRSVAEMKKMILGSRIAIKGRSIYFYNRDVGTRFLTCESLRSLASLDNESLRQHLLEIQAHCNSTNRRGMLEVDFFMVGTSVMREAFAIRDFSAATMSPAEVRREFEALCQRFWDVVSPAFRCDDPDSPLWRSCMYGALIGQTEILVSEEALLGLAAEFFMQVEWLPGARIEEGELIIDSMFAEEDSNPHLPAGQRACDEIARGLIFNFIRDYGDLEYVNIGRVVGSLCSSRQPRPNSGRRGVYVAEIKRRERPQPILRIIRLQKWGVADRLDEYKDMLKAIQDSEEYTDYILYRRLGCRQFQMNLPPRVMAKKVSERYVGRNGQYYGQTIPTAYFERDYIAGVATDKIPNTRFADPEYARAFARVLGRAAAPNLIVGRTHTDELHSLVFDDGDELVIEDSRGIPFNIVVADHTGTFVDVLRPLEDLAPAYARSVIKRADFLLDFDAFADEFVRAFVERFTLIQEEYRRHKASFDNLFKHLPQTDWTFAWRWQKVLQRLRDANGPRLGQLIRSHAIRPASTPALAAPVPAAPAPAAVACG